MFPMTSKGPMPGSCVAPADVCKLPNGVPVPFVNVALCPQATAVAQKVLIENKPVLNVGSKIPISMGDEPGVGGGVVSGVFKNACKWKQSYAKVKVQGKSALRMLHTTGQNGSSSNIVGAQLAPTQVKVFLSG
jgi:hypothetical protein